MDAIASLNCLLEAGLISQDQRDSMAQVISKLPSDPTALLQLLVALTLTEEA